MLGFFLQRKRREAQVDLFRSIIHENYRPIQALYDRTVYSN
jgi:carbonic anhydrase